MTSRFLPIDELPDDAPDWIRPTRRIQIGAGPDPLDGFVNVEPRATNQPGYVKGHACDLSFAGDATVDVIFANAVLEHLYVPQVGVALKECKRVLRATGVAVILGIPDFETICRLYLDKAPGITLKSFELLEVYRYTHGFPEAQVMCEWAKWSPSEHLNDAPPEWLPQLHKCLFDATFLKELLERIGLPATVFRYCYPGESRHPVNLGVIFGPQPHGIEALDLIPNVGCYIDRTTIETL